MKIAMYSEKGEKKEDRDIKSPIFETAVNPILMHEVVVAIQSNRRMDNAKAKKRGEVAGGGIKPWKQKGTGRARSGSIRNPIWRGGGVTFGPTGEQNHHKEVPKKKKRNSLISALVSKKADMVILESISTAKTKDFAKSIEKINGKRRGLVIFEGLDEKTVKASRNIEGIKVSDYRNLNTYEVLAANKLIFVGKSLDNLLEFLG